MAVFRDSPYRCEFCGIGLDANDPNVARRALCWVKNKSSSARFPGAVTAWAHWVCLEAAKMGVRPDPDDAPTMF
jgi:hypothetical protein